MNLKLKSCKSDAQGMTLVAVDTDTGVEASTTLSLRTCGGPFLQHDASVKQLVGDLFDALNVAATAAIASSVEADAQAIEAQREREEALADRLKKPSRAPKGAA